MLLLRLFVADGTKSDTQMLGFIFGNIYCSDFSDFKALVIVIFGWTLHCLNFSMPPGSLTFIPLKPLYKQGLKWQEISIQVPINFGHVSKDILVNFIIDKRKKKFMSNQINSTINMYLCSVVSTRYFWCFNTPNHGRNVQWKKIILP